MHHPKIAVFGSINLDIQISTPHFPRVGETLLASSIIRLPGGKGANQAVAAARLGAQVSFVGAVGDDEAGDYLLKVLAQEHIRLSHIQKISSVPTGTAYVVRSELDNYIIVNSGANFAWDYLPEQWEIIIQKSDVVLLQLEIPLKFVEIISQIAWHHKVPIILNPAPAILLPPTLLKKVSAITPNAQELWQITCCDQHKEELPITLYSQRNQLIITQGEDGVVYFDNGLKQRQKAHQVEVIDTTGAGDVFNGALAAFWHLGKKEAIKRACAAATLSIQKIGAQSGAPNDKELELFLTHF